RVDQHDRARARRHQRLDLVRIGQEVLAGMAAVVDRPAVVEDGGRRPQRVVGRGQQHFVARVEQGAQADVDQLAHAVADEHVVGAHAGGAARGVLRGHGLARGGQALLVRVGIGGRDAVGDGALQVLGRAETEGARVADVELDQRVAAGLEFPRAAGELAADLVAHLGQAFPGGDAGLGHAGWSGVWEAQRLAEFPARIPADDPPPRLRVNPVPDALRAIGWPHAGPPGVDWAGVMAAHPAARPARVVEQHRTGYEVAEGPDDGVAGESLPEWQRAKCPPDARAAVGDRVLVEDGRIVALLPRHGVIKRASAGEHYGQQLIAANVDTVFVVCGLDGDFNPRRIERYLLLVQGGGAQPVGALTEAD